MSQSSDPKSASSKRPTASKHARRARTGEGPPGQVLRTRSSPVRPAAVRREVRDPPLRSGPAVTIAATAWMVHKSLAAAQELAREGIEAEVLDLRTLNPLDTDSVVASVRKTGRLVVAHEAWKVGGIGGEVAATVAELAFDALQGPIVRVGAPHVPIPSASELRNRVIPTRADVVAAVHQTLST